MNPQAIEDSLEDAAARRAAAGDLESNVMLDAGAGTGKTTVMVERILNVIGTGATLDHIVAITFTEKAAGELQVRVRDAIERRLRESSSGAVAERMLQALRDVERANISTIHAFCARLLRERPIEAGVEPGFAVFDELNAFLLKYEVWDEWLEEALDREDPVLARIIDLDVSRRSLRGAAFRLLDQRDLLDLLPARKDADAAGFLEKAESELAWLQQQTTACKDPNDGALVNIRNLARDLDKVRALQGEERDRFLQFEWTIHHGKGSRTKWSPPELGAQVKDRLKELSSGLGELKKSLAHNIVVEAHKWLVGFVERYRGELQVRGGIDFTDLLIRARDVLRDRKDVRGDLQRRFTHILVDEFQDTDPLQAEIVFYLAEKAPVADRWDEVDLAPGKLFVVGDPKQSIYRFRRADIEMYEAAKRLLAQGREPLTLSTNFRSARPVVDWINGAFAQLIQQPVAGAYQPEYVPIRPCSEAPFEGGVWIVPVDAEAEDSGSLLVAEARRFAALIQRAVAEGWKVTKKGETHPLQYRDVGVLFRTNQPMRVYEEAFRELEIPYRIVGGQRFYQREEITALQALLRALANPGDSVAVVATLRGPFLGISDEDLFLHKTAGGTFNYAVAISPELPRAPLFAAAYDLLLRFHRRAPEVAPSVLLGEFFAETRLLPLFALQAQGDQRVANLLKVINFARNLAAERALTFRGFVRTLEYMAEVDAEESDSPVAEDTDDVVHLLTIHKAKGLEFPFVMLANGGQNIDKRTDLPIADRLGGRLALGLPASGHKPLHTLAWNELKEHENQCTEAEARRVLYVAATRARDFLVLPRWPEDAAGDFIGLLLDAGGAAGYETPLDAEARRPPPYRLRWPIAEAADAASAAAEAAVVREIERWQEDRRELWRSAAPELRPCSATSIKSEAEGEGVAFRGRGGAQMGTAVHQILRRVGDPGEVAAVAEGVCRALNLEGNPTKIVAELARRALRLPVAAELVGSPSVFREVPFVWRDGDLLIEGQIDLVFRRDGGLVVVDYKTDDVKPGAALEERARIYRPQAVTYACALERITRTPVVEVVLAFLRPGVESHLRLDWTAEWERLRAGVGS